MTPQGTLDQVADIALVKKFFTCENTSEEVRDGPKSLTKTERQTDKQKQKDGESWRQFNTDKQSNGQRQTHGVGQTNYQTDTQSGRMSIEGQSKKC